ncbi:polysaccharide biosynthesis/export family protein [Xanthocytophaga agilis]|uniref:polysaccharide biosynthesis/export family protein n=1 Tax=Xanthocytophaga agilis TaxID=3048010 RepID=UPI0028D6B9A5|nr:polysaccharide biosynthesis/export family protein [Xanthocytophaga agilis]
MRIKNALNLVKIIALWFLVNACIPKHHIVYFPNPSLNKSSPVTTPNTLPVYKLQPTDVLSIRIKTLNKETSDYFNIVPENGVQQWNPAGLYINGYSINAEGDITLPEVGKVKVAGMTVEEAQKAVQEKVKTYVGNVTILLKLISFKVTVLGEVNNPGYYYIYNDNATLLNALAMAGDLTDFGNRTNIVLVRQTKEGTQSIVIDLNDPDVLSSKYYYLMPNDAIYVQPFKAKYARSNVNTLSVLGVLFGAISSTILILNYLK